MLYELSVPISPETVRYDDTIPKPVLRSFTSISNGDVNNQTEFSLFAHLGSHVDAPYHFCENGKKLNDICIDNFIFRRALLINVETGKGGRITAEQIRMQKGIEGADILLFNMGYSEYCSNGMIYRDDFPAITSEAAVFLREELPMLKAIALDTLSVDGTDGFKNNFVNHHTLLDTREDGLRPLLIYENIDFTPILGTEGYFSVYGIPLRLCGAEASPVTMVAEIE